MKNDNNPSNLKEMPMTLHRVLQQIKIAAEETPRLYFAPITGAYKGIRAEFAMLESLRTNKATHHRDR